MASTLSLSDYANKLPPEARQRYIEKLNLKENELPDPYSLSSGWKSDPVDWPDVTFGDIYTYLIDRQSIYTRDSMKAFKSLEAYSYVVSGHVKEVLYHAITADSTVCFLTAKVIPSQRINDEHHPWVCVDKNTATVLFGHCTCMAGLDEVCSHVAAILFKVEIGVKLGLTKQSSTSSACQWNKCFRNEVEPLTVAELQNLIGGRQKQVESYNASGTAELPPIDILISLYEVCPNAAFFTSIPPLCDTQKARSPLPPLLSVLIDESTEFTQEELLAKWDTYSCSQETCLLLEKQTRSQAECPLWFQHRRGRITGSKAHDVLVRQTDTDPQILVQNLMGYQTYNLSKREAIKWGIENEEKARNMYIEVQKSHHKNLQVRTAGFMIDHENPYLGASPDGMCKCDCCGTGCVEIRCPFTAKGNTIAEALTDPKFCLDNSMNLKQNHRYYSQVQFQMKVTGVNYCDFVVYTSKEIAIVRITLDENFVANMHTKCETFFRSFLLPEIVMRKLEKAVSDDGLEPIKDLICICQQPVYGKVINCQNKDCEFVKFHYECVNIRRKPRKAWLCPKCVDKDKDL